MTPLEKAQDLFTTYRYALSIPNAIFGELKDNVAKQCALIAIDEILESNPTLITCNTSELNYAYWIEVKKEIEKL